MTSWFGSILLVIGILCGACAWAQTDAGSSDTGAPTQPGPTPAFTYPDTTPSLDFLSQSAENSSITLGISTGFSYDSNAYALSKSQNWWLFHVTPSVKIQQFRPTLRWHVSYAGGYQTYTGRSGQNANSNLFGQHAGAGFLWQLARHWQLLANDNFSYTADPFGTNITRVGTPTINNPNPVSYYPLTQYTLNDGLLTLTDQLTKVDTLSFTGTANLRRTSTYNIVTAVPFYNLVSYGGRASYAHRLSPRLSLGAGYDYNSLDFGKGQQRSGIQTISMTVDYLIRPNMTISGWIGPEYTSTKTILGVPIFGQIVYITTRDSMWSTALGANFGWHGRRSSFRAGFSRHVSDGSGIIATSTVNLLTASYRRMLTPKMDATVGVRYFHDVSISTTRRNFDNFTFDAGLTYKLTKSLVASGQYAHLQQTQSNAFLIGNNNYTSNLVGASITYTWNHPLGR